MQAADPQTITITVLLGAVAAAIAVIVSALGRQPKAGSPTPPPPDHSLATLTVHAAQCVELLRTLTGSVLRIEANVGAIKSDVAATRDAAAEAATQAQEIARSRARGRES